MNIVLVEDQRILRDSLAVALDAQDDMTVVAKLASANDAPEAMKRFGGELALMDICTEGGASGITAARRIKAQMPKARVVLITGMPEVTFIEQAQDAGVDSFVYKDVGTGELLSVIRSTARGYSIYPHKSHNKIAGIVFNEEELAILRLVCEAKSRKEIASELYLSEGTVKRRISEILAKTGYQSILKLAIYAVSNDLIAPQVKS